MPSHLMLPLVLLAVIAGCSDGPVPPEPPVGRGARTLKTAGDRQVGRVGTELPALLEVTVLDASDRAVTGTAVFWESPLNGRIEPLDGRTDAAGRARARFILGDRVGQAYAHVIVPAADYDSVSFAFEAREEVEPGLPPYDAILTLAFATYDGSGETVHPDWAEAPGWTLPQQIALTPYPGGDASHENPSLFGSGNGLTWAVPAGVSNPVARPAGGHLSDPDLLYLAEREELWLYYRQTDSRNPILLSRSGDRGLTWSAPAEVISTPNHEVLSPAVVRRAPSEWWMWSVNGRRLGCSAADAVLEVRRSSDGISWGAPQPLSLAHDGLFPWHVDVQWIASRGEFVAVYNAKLPGSCTTPALFLATSPDGVRWTPLRAPLVVKGATPVLQDIVYRATFRVDAATGDLWLWVSGARLASGRWAWGTVFQRRPPIGVLAAEGGPATPLVFPPPPAELVEWP